MAISFFINNCTALLTILITVDIVSVDAQTKEPEPFVVRLSDTTSHHQEVFGGPPQTVTMHSGLVVLVPSRSVGKHSTKSYEEAIVVFSGTGEFRFSSGEILKLSANSVLYCPPNTEHDVVNTGNIPLKYLYIVSKLH
jgi:mannose-6-phosphate isomerase-like protein (cupin superfamily)